MQPHVRKNVIKWQLAAAKRADRAGRTADAARYRAVARDLEDNRD